MVHDLVTTDPEILGGMPVITGTRVLVYDLAASMKAGIRGVAFWRPIPPLRTNIWIWRSLMQKPIHCSGGLAGFRHGQVHLW